MKRVMIIFPDTTSLAGFILLYKVSNAEVNTGEISLVAPLSDAEIIAACTQFGGTLHYTKAAEPDSIKFSKN